MSTLAAVGGYVLACVLGLFAGHVRAQESVGSSIQPVVYANDDRVDWYLIQSPDMQSLARQSIVAVVQTAALDFANPGAKWPPFTDVVGTLDSYVTTAYGAPLCPSQRFVSQPSGAVCSGTLIADDLVLTAGHCVSSQAACEQLRFVFDYLEIADGVLDTIDAEDVYECQRVLAFEDSATAHLDYGIVQLDRPVVGRVPANIRRATTPLPVATPLVVLGFGSGLPMKFDDGGEVIDPHAGLVDAFIANTDTFGGNSGSGVFTDDGTLVGVLVSGRSDYSADATCSTVNVLPDADADEASTYVFHAVDALCAGGYPSAVCPNNPSATCGDRFCSAGEDAASCPRDCTGLRCADGACTAGETHANCPYDCVTDPHGGSHGRCSVGAPGDSERATGVFAMLVMLGAGIRSASRSGHTQSRRISGRR